jgi:outer membrane protein
MFAGLLTGLALLSVGDCFAVSLEAVSQDLKENIEEGSVLGLGVLYLERPYKGRDNDVYPCPIISLKYKRFFIDSTTIGLNLIDGDRFKFSVIGAPRFGGYEADDSPELNGMDDRDWSFDAGLRGQIKNDVLAFTVTGLADTLNEYQGQEISATVSAKLYKGLLRPRIGVHWLSEELVDYYYGVRGHEVRADRPLYSVDATVDYVAGMAIGIPVGPSWAVVLDAQYEFFGDEIADSPIVDADGIGRYTAGVVYRF